jgi:CheY-like chemotaxis protein
MMVTTDAPPVTQALNRHILVCDDTPSIHDDFVKILSPPPKPRQSLASLMATLRDEKSPEPTVATAEIIYELEHAYQGREALERVEQATKAGRAFALAFVDVRMPPGWDGIETIKHLWECDPFLEVVICTAYSDYTWESILDQLGTTDRLQFLRKPVDFVSVKQMGLSLTTKWNLGRRSRQYVEDLETEVRARTRQLSEKITELQRAMDEIRQLRGIVPMCAYCHRIRDDENFWRAVDDYIRTHTEAEVSHGVCPACYEKLMGHPLQ